MFLRMFVILIVPVMVILIVGVNYHFITHNGEIMQFSNKCRNSNATGYLFYPKIFGHVHMAKTAGTAINGELASHFERICGHKGFSYDYVEYNSKVRAITNGTLKQDVFSSGVVSDIISEKYYDGFNRGRVPAALMDEIGYQDCDWISHEAQWDYWKRMDAITNEVNMELHVPCRDPIDHLMSQCNFRSLTFDCNSPNLTYEVHGCLVAMDRFDNQLMAMSNIEIKCFNPLPVDGYVEYMKRFLQQRRLHTNYVKRATNQKRNIEQECVWKNKTLMQNVLDILIAEDYYGFCHRCMSSEKRLPL